jgi:DHA3 family macrolide efflux protein-like MFS transporter
VVSQVGDYFAILALMVVVAGFTENNAQVTTYVSGLMIALTLPRLLFGVLAGVFVDRWDRRRTMIVSDLVRSVVTLLMIPAFLTKNLWAIYVLAFTMSTFATLFNPAKGALLPLLVSKEQLVSANSLSQTSMMMAGFVGPALAGPIFAVFGPWVAFVFDSFSFLVSAVAIWAIRMPKAEPAVEQTTTDETEVSPLRRVWQELIEGLRALFLNRVMAVVSLVFAVTMLGVGALNVLWVAFLRVNFGFETGELAWRIGVIDIVFSAGMVIASIAVGNFMSHIAPKWFIVWGLIFGGAFIAPLGYLSNYWILVALCLIVGASIAPTNTGTATLTQIVVPNHQLGRVGGGIGTIVDTASLVSMSLAGVLAATLGIAATFLLAGLLCIVGGAIAWLFIPGLTLKDKPEEPKEPEGELSAIAAGAGPITALTPQEDETLIGAR